MSDYSRVDANLIVVLDAILTHRHLTRAGQAIGMAQPTMSNSLARLRHQLDDPILVRRGRSSVLTPAAEAMAADVRRAVSRIEGLYTVRSAFDPTVSQRFFLVTAPESIAMELSAPLVRILSVDAPTVTVDFDDVPSFEGAAVDGLLQRRDAVISTTDRPLPGRSSALLSDQLVVVVDAAHPLLRGGRLELDDLASLRIVAERRGMDARVTGMLGDIAPAVRAVVTGASALQSAEMVVGTPYFAIVPSRQAARAAARGVAVAGTALRPATIVHAAYWHPSRYDDAAVQWLLGVLRRAAEEVEFPDGPMSFAR